MQEEEKPILATFPWKKSLKIMYLILAPFPCIQMLEKEKPTNDVFTLRKIKSRWLGSVFSTFFGLYLRLVVSLLTF